MEEITTSTFSIEFNPTTVAIGFTTTLIPEPTSSDVSSSETGAVATGSAGSTATLLPSSTATTTSTAPASTTSVASAASSGLSTGQIIGIIIGSVVGGCLLLLAIFYFCLRRNKKRVAEQTLLEKEDPDAASVRRKNTRHLFHLPARQQTANVPPTNQQNEWTGSVNPEEIGVAVVPTERQGFLQRIRNSTVIRPILPISAPVLEPRTSVRASFQDRFFAPPPPPIPPTDPGTVKHISDATTIRTSGNPPTPNGPPILVLRPYSTTSIGTEFEEDRDQDVDRVPPVPSFTAVPIQLQSIKEKRSQERSNRSSLENGIKRSISKASSHNPITSRHNHPADDDVPESSTRNPRGVQPKVTTNTPQPKVSRLVDKSLPTTPDTGTLSSRTEETSTIGSPNSVQPDIPVRSTSRRKVRRTLTEEAWLMAEKKLVVPYSGDYSVLRPPPLAIHKTDESSVSSTIRNLAYPQIPASAAESTSQSAAVQAPSTQEAPQAGRPKKKSGPRYLLRPSDKKEPVGGSSSREHIVQQFQPPAKLDVPSAGEDGSQSRSESDVPSPRAILTPNKTRSGDLVLTVNM